MASQSGGSSPNLGSFAATTGQYPSSFGAAFVEQTPASKQAAIPPMAGPSKERAPPVPI
jgi:hypothetical protein